jgi:hypothetical protein
MGLMVAIPPNQCRVTDVFKQKFQGRRFDVAVAKDDVGFALMSGVSSLVTSGTWIFDMLSLCISSNVFPNRSKIKAQN